MHHLPPKIVVTAKAGVGIEKIQLLVDANEPADSGLELLTSAMPGVRELDRITRQQRQGEGDGK